MSNKASNIVHFSTRLIATSKKICIFKETFTTFHFEFYSISSTYCLADIIMEMESELYIHLKKVF